MPARSDRWNHHGYAGQSQWLDQPGLRVISLVCNDRAHLSVLEQHVCAFKVMGLSGREVKTRRIAQRIDWCMNFGRKAAMDAPHKMASFRPLFLAPAMVESIMQYLLSAFCAKAAKMC